MLVGELAGNPAGESQSRDAGGHHGTLIHEGHRCGLVGQLVKGRAQVNIPRQSCGTRGLTCGQREPDRTIAAVLANQLHVHTVIVAAAKVVERYAGCNVGRVRVRLKEAPAAEHSVLFAVGGDERETVRPLHVRGKELRKMKENGNARTVIVGTLNCRGGLIVMCHHDDLPERGARKPADHVVERDRATVVGDYPLVEAASQPKVCEVSQNPFGGELVVRLAAVTIREGGDELGLKRGIDGGRRLPDGRPLEIIVETSGESTEETDVLELIRETWREVGIKLLSKPSQREVFRNRIFAGETLMSIWKGLENAIATPDMSPEELAPTNQQQLQWPKFGQFYETSGKSGSAPDIPEVAELLKLFEAWRAAGTHAKRAEIWHRMLKIHTEQQFVIGTVNAVPQPVVVRNSLVNVPEKGLYGWEPGAYFGIYRPDTFWFK